jgi:hypothetical protein
MTAGVAEALERFELAVAAVAQQRDERKAATARSRRAVAEALVFRDELSAALRLVSQDRPEVVNRTRLRVDKVSNAPRLIDWLTNLQHTVEELREPLRPFFACDPVKLVEQHRFQLMQSMGEQIAERRLQSERVAKQLDACSDLASALARLRLAARIAFAREPVVLRQFRKGVVRRRRTVPLAPRMAEPLVEKTAQVEPPLATAGAPLHGSSGAGSSESRAAADGSAAVLLEPSIVQREHRAVRAPDDILGHRPGQRGSAPSAPVRAHHDEVEALALGALDDAAGRIAQVDGGGDRQARLDRLGLASLEVGLATGAHVQQRELGLHVDCEVDGRAQGSRRSSGEIDGAEDLLPGGVVHWCGAPTVSRAVDLY